MALSESDIENRRMIDWQNEKAREEAKRQWEAYRSRFEFTGEHICMETNTDCAKGAHKIAERYNEGWHLCSQITCPPFVIIIFSRLKENTEHAQS